MDINQLRRALGRYQLRREFDNWIANNERELSNYFHKLNGQDLNHINFDSFYYKDLCNSSVYKEYHSNKEITTEFSFFLNLISIAAEKLAEIGLDSVARNIVSDLPESGSKFRLQALNRIFAVEDIRTDYVEELPEVLNLLDRSRLFEDGGTRQNVDVLAYYYNKAKSTLTKAKLPKTLEELNKKFSDRKLIQKFPFLSHSILVDLINNVDPFALYPTTTPRDRLEPSPVIRSLFGDINGDFFGHPCIKDSKNDLWGYDVRYILDEVLVRGRGDFSRKHGEISADDKVLLYCYYNMKKHFFTSYAVFQTVVSSLNKFFSNSDYKPVFIDLGCGPMTSGLALADLIHTTTGKKINFTYIGIDISKPMLAKAKSFNSLSIFSSDSTFDFYSNWSQIELPTLKKIAGRYNPIILNASYLFASTSLDVKDLYEYVNAVARNFSNVFFVFQNPNRTDRNSKYYEFKSGLKSYTSLVECSEKILYKPASVESIEDVYYEILKL